MKPGPGALAFAGGALLWFILAPGQETLLLAVLSNTHPFSQKLTELPTPIRLFLLALVVAFLDILGFRAAAGGIVMLAITVWILRFAASHGVGGTSLSSALNLKPLQLSGAPAAATASVGTA